MAQAITIEPAGDASPSMPDYGRFLQLHFAYATIQPSRDIAVGVFLAQ